MSPEVLTKRVVRCWTLAMMRDAHWQTGEVVCLLGKPTRSCVGRFDSPITAARNDARLSANEGFVLRVVLVGF